MMRYAVGEDAALSDGPSSWEHDGAAGESSDSTVRAQTAGSHFQELLRALATEYERALQASQGCENDFHQVVPDCSRTWRDLIDTDASCSSLARKRLELPPPISVVTSLNSPAFSQRSPQKRPGSLRSRRTPRAVSESETSLLHPTPGCMPESPAEKLSTVHESQNSAGNSSRTPNSRAPGTPKSHLFLDVEEMKEKVRKTLMRKSYNVADFYHESGFFQALAVHPVFEHFTLAVVLLNALWIWVDTDYNDAEVLTNAMPVFQVAEHAFCTFFVTEWFVRFMAFKRKMNGLRDRWFMFDSLLTFVMVF